MIKRYKRAVKGCIYLFNIFLWVIFLIGTTYAKDRDTFIDAEIDWWISQLNGHMKIEEAGIEGTKIDFDDDLEIDEYENIINFRLDYRFFEKHHFEFAYFSQSFTSTPQKIQRRFTHQGKQYEPGDQIKAEFAMEATDYLYGYDLIRNEKGELTLNVGVRYGELHQALEATNPPYAGYLPPPSRAIYSRRSEVIKAWVPLIGFGGEVEIIKGLSISGRLRGLSIDTADVADIISVEDDYEEIKLIDGTMVLNYDPIKYLRIFVGYRIMQLKAADIDDEIKSRMEGPVFGIIGSF